MIDVIFIGLSIGSILLLVALGLAITYGAMGVINMAHGEMVMLGAYTTVIAGIWLHLGLLVSFPLAFIVTALARLADRTCIRAAAVWPAVRHAARHLGRGDPAAAGGAAGLRPVLLRHPYPRASAPGLQNVTVPTG